MLRQVGEYLQDRTDLELVQATEKAYNRALPLLYKYMVGRETDVDYIDECPPTLEWLHEWMGITKDNEAPGVFHAMSALAVVASLIGRSRWIEMGFFKIYAPLSVVLVGPSGTRKSTAISIAQRLRMYCPIADKLKTAVIQEKTTPEALAEAAASVGKGVTIFMAVPEMATAFGKQTYLAGLVPMLTRLMDHERYEDRTRKSGAQAIEEVGLGMLCGTTEDWITSAMTADVVKGGFTSRILWVAADRTTRMVFRAPAAKATAIINMAERLAPILEKTGLMEIEQGATAMLETWYSAHKIRMDAYAMDAAASYLNRKLTHILRIALVLAVLADHEQITALDVNHAMDLLEHLERPMLSLLHRLAVPDGAADAQVIQELLPDTGTMSKQDLLRILARNLPLSRIEEGLSLLLECGYVQTLPNKSGKGVYYSKVGGMG